MNEAIYANTPGAQALNIWLHAGFGRAAKMARDSGIVAPVISKMKNGVLPISLPHALLLEIHSGHALTVGVLCPQLAHLVSHRPIASHE